MIGPSERPSRLPRENRSAPHSKPAPSHRQERAALLSFYAAKLAAIYLYARKDQITAMVAALRSEERAALRALRERQAITFERGKPRRLAVRPRLLSLRPTRPKKPAFIKARTSLRILTS
jgi:hypothetical protein